MKYIGIAFCVLTVAGMLNLIDFHVCIAGDGQCDCKIESKP